jgi:hypothetical protein
VFRRDRPMVTAHYVQQHMHMHFAPRLNLTVLAWQSERRDSASDRPILPEARLRIDQETHVLRTLVHSIESSGLEQLVYRVVTQGQRIEAGTSAISAPLAPGLLTKPAASAPAFSTVPDMPPVRQVVRRAGPLETDPAVPGRAAASPHGVNQAANQTANLKPQPSNPAVDVNQLTDQVVKIIDQRIIAQRERLGRV